MLKWKRQVFTAAEITVHYHTAHTHDGLTCIVCPSITRRQVWYWLALTRAGEIHATSFESVPFDSLPTRAAAIEHITHWNDDRQAPEDLSHDDRMDQSRRPSDATPAAPSLRPML